MKLLGFLAIALAVTNPAFAAPKSLQTLLREFDRDPKKFMDTLPEKKKPGVSLFDKDAIRKKDYISAKNKNRKLIGRAGIQYNDMAEELVDNGSRLIRNLKDMESRRLLSARLPENPWSDYYWALYNGQLAYRYADSNYPASKDWKKNSDFLKKNFFNFRDSSSTDTLSPAEKYDILVGDTRMTLTKHALAEGEQYYRSQGEVESWMGLCHGWAAVSYMMDRPSSAIEVTAADGQTRIKFYPSDIKALATLLWSVYPGETRFIGGRCDVKNPEKSPEGRVTDQGCFDTNPGAWHLSIVNQIGVSKRSVVMDATYDYEVWNHPVLAYDYTYFNPQTLRPARTLRDAMVPVEKFSNDKFKSYRDSKAAYVVGISMNVEYVIETNPTTATTDGPNDDATNTVSYQYDLELDERGNIIGGEWYRNAHPDFLWTPEPKARASTPGDRMIRSRWDGRSPLPRDWSSVAQRNSQGGVPLAAIVETLIQLSNSPLRR